MNQLNELYRTEIMKLEYEMNKLMAEVERLRAENAELRASLDKALDDMRTVTVTDINMRDLMELADRLDAQGQHPGFPQPPARVTNPDEPNGTCPTRGTIFGDGDPDEPVAGTG